MPIRIPLINRVVSFHSPGGLKDVVHKDDAQIPDAQRRRGRRFEAHAGAGRDVELSSYACLESLPARKSGPRTPQAEVRRLSFVMATPEIHKLRGVPERRADDCVLLDLMSAAGLSPRPAAPAPRPGDPGAILPVPPTRT